MPRANDRTHFECSSAAFSEPSLLEALGQCLFDLLAAFKNRAVYVDIFGLVGEECGERLCIVIRIGLDELFGRLEDGAFLFRIFGGWFCGRLIVVAGGVIIHGRLSPTLDFAADGAEVAVAGSAAGVFLAALLTSSPAPTQKAVATRMPRTNPKLEGRWEASGE